MVCARHSWVWGQAHNHSEAGKGSTPPSWEVHDPSLNYPSGAPPMGEEACWVGSRYRHPIWIAGFGTGFPPIARDPGWGVGLPSPQMPQCEHFLVTGLGGGPFQWSFWGRGLLQGPSPPNAPL